MSRSTPFHKQTDPNKQAGQVVYKVTVIDNNHPDGIPYEDWVRPVKCDCAQSKYNDGFHSRSCSSVYGFDREPYLKHSNVAPDVALSDYIARKQEGPSRITFEEWWNTVGEDLHGNYYREVYEEVWNTALTKGKL